MSTSTHDRKLRRREKYEHRLDRNFSTKRILEYNLNFSSFYVSSRPEHWAKMMKAHQSAQKYLVELEEEIAECYLVINEMNDWLNANR